MLDDVAIYLVVAPVAFTVALVGLTGFWLARRSAPIHVARRPRIDS